MVAEILTIDNALVTADGGSTDDGSPTLGRMRNQIIDELDRPDLADQILNAIRRSVNFWKRERFAFNDGAVAFATTPGQDGYGAADAAGLPLFQVDSAVASDGATAWPLRVVTMDDVERLVPPGETGQPCWYAKFGEGVRLYPTPDAAYTIRFTGHLRLDAPPTEAQANAWTDEAYDLIAAYAKRYLALHVLKDPGLKAMMDVTVGEASASLKGLATQMTGTGVVRAYDL